MAELLYRLGKWCAQHAKTVIFAWLAILVVLGGTVGLLGVKMTDEMDVGQTETTRVADRVQEVLSDGGDGGGTDSAQMVARTADGTAFTDEQREGIEAAMERAEDVEHVSAVVDPFATDEQLADGKKQIEDGREQIADGRAQLEDAQKQIDEGRKQAEDGQAQLDAAREQMAAAGLPAEAIDQQLAPQQEQIDVGLAQADEGQKELDENATELDENAATLERNAKLLELTGDMKMVSDDGSAAVITITFDSSGGVIPADQQEAVRDAFAAEDVAGVDFYFSGSPEVGSIIGVGEIVGVVIAAIVLIVMLGTVVAAGLPLITAIIGVGVGACIAMLIGLLTPIASVTPVLGIMLGLAVGIDYSLFIVNRHRIQLKQGNDVVHSAALATGTSGNAVVFAGATVIIALLALNFSGLPFLGLMGTVGAISVAVAVLIAITMTPALLGGVKLKVLRRKERAAAEKADPVASMHHSAAGLKSFPLWKAAVTVVVAVAALIVIALPALDMRTNLPDNGTQAHDSSEYIAYTTISDKFGAGQNSPLIVLADLPDGLGEDEATDLQIEIGQELKGMGGVHAVAPVALSADRSEAVFQVIPTDGPTSEATENLVHDLRDASPLDGKYELGVAGSASANIDMSAKIVGSLPLYLVIVVGLSFLILILVFRSLLVPLIATLGFVLSYLASLGGVVAVYQWGWLADVFGVDSPGPILSFLPTIMVGVLFGLAMDYMFFLGSGMREAYAHGTEARLAVVQGVRAGRSVVIAAAVIMISVFAGFIFSEMTMIRPIGFGLAFGVLLDAFVVRLVIIPSLMTLLGRSAWWLPKWLDKIIPNVDVEGSSLQGRHTHAKG